MESIDKSINEDTVNEATDLSTNSFWKKYSKEINAILNVVNTNIAVVQKMNNIESGHSPSTFVVTLERRNGNNINLVSRSAMEIFKLPYVVSFFFEKNTIEVLVDMKKI